MLKSKLKFPAKRQKVSAFSLQPSAFTCGGFTMVEIAISLAVIGIALVSIIGVLPIGMHTQRDNRQETIINQDATLLMEAIRNGAQGLDDLTNYVYAITNYVTHYPVNGSPTTNIDGYTYTSATGTPNWTIPFWWPITNGMRIVGLLSTPEYTDINGQPLFSINNNIEYYSNHVVAYIRSMSGPAVEKPPQDPNSLIVGDSFTYRVLCVNAPVPMFTPLLWVSQAYNAGATVTYKLNGQVTYWQATGNTGAADQPGVSPLWARVLYPEVLRANLHEVRLSFFWPQQPNGSLGPGRQTFRTLVAGQLVMNTNDGAWSYFYQPQSFVNVTNAP
ncbi:MAG: prepilin-type N-terminal cleavage/methylation domain-containing protein [Limisphaerales bacterium]